MDGYAFGPEMTYHALMRFRERIQELSDAEIQAWCKEQWRCRKQRAGMPKTNLRQRPYKHKPCSYLECRAPNGKPVFLALSHDRSAVLTVLDAWHWNQFIGTNPNPQVREREAIIAKLRAADTKKGSSHGRHHAQDPT